jgi:hypothetical protein
VVGNVAITASISDGAIFAIPGYMACDYYVKTGGSDADICGTWPIYQFDSSTDEWVQINGPTEGSLGEGLAISDDNGLAEPGEVAYVVGLIRRSMRS